MTHEIPTALRPALPELSELAAGLVGITEAANVIYEAEKLDTSPDVEDGMVGVAEWEAEHGRRGRRGRRVR